jgi:hypothetical protein
MAVQMAACSFPLSRLVASFAETPVRHSALEQLPHGAIINCHAPARKPI